MEKREVVNILHKTDPFEILEPDVLEDLATKVTIRHYRPNTYVFRQGDVSQDALFIIVAGLVEITSSNDRGVESVVGVRRPHDFFSETVVLSQQRYPASARVKEALTCCLVKRRDLERLIYSYPEFSGFFNTLLAERMRRLYSEIVSEQSYEAYGMSESPMFRKRVSEVMSAPVITCQAHDKVTAVAQTMDELDISTIVVLDQERRPRGIITEKNIVKHLIAAQACPVETCRADNIMKSNIVTIAPEAFLGQALVTMIRSKTKYLLVIERGNLIGIVTMVDLLKTRSTGTLLLTQDIESQHDLRGLAAISREVDGILYALVVEKAGVREIFEVMSELHERMTRRVLQLSEERMRLEGWGPPPVDYCWVNMGSAARYEQTLRSDQDNAIIFDDPPGQPPEDVDAYFAQFAAFAVDGLAACGFEKCAGDVMATNPKWRRPLSAWIESVLEWTRSYDPEDTRILTILLDYRPIWGNVALAEKFREAIFAAFRESITARHMMTRDDLQYKLPINFLGTFVTTRSGPHKNQIDLKKAGTLHIVNGIRIFAIKNEISEPSTFGRLQELVARKAIPAEDAELFEASFETLMMFRIRENAKKARQGHSPDNHIDPYSLRKRERMILKDALSGVSQLQKLVNSQFNVAWLRHWV
jgi:CBS domain-containing protein